MEKIVLIATELIASQPLLPDRKLNSQNEIYRLFKSEKIELLVYCFQKEQTGFNKSLLICYPHLWEDFSKEDWNNLVIKMFPRESFDKHTFKNINSGWYSDILLLNGIIGIDPFDLIFDNKALSLDDKKKFYQYLKHRGEYHFYINEKEFIEDVVELFEPNVLKIIASMKELLLKEGFSVRINHEEALNKYSKYNLE